MTMIAKSAVQRYRDRHKALGLCRYCPQSVEGGHAMCLGHLLKRRSVMHREYLSLKQRRKLLGLCLFCLNLGSAGPQAQVLLCAGHRGKLNAWSRAYCRRTYVPTGRPPGRPRQSFGKPPQRVASDYPYFREGQAIDGMEFLLTINAAIPQWIIGDQRAEVCQELAVAVLEKRIQLQEIPAKLSTVLKAIRREYPTKYGPISIDQPLRGSRTLLRELL